MTKNLQTKKHIKISKDFFKGLNIEIKVPKFAVLHECCPKCRERRNEQMKLLLADSKKV